MGQMRKIHDAGILMEDAELRSIIKKDDNTFIVSSFHRVFTAEHDCKWKGDKFPTTAKAQLYSGATNPCDQLDVTGENMLFWDVVFRR